MKRLFGKATFAFALVLGLTACAGHDTPKDAAADLAVTNTLAVSAWNVYLGFANCDSPEGAAAAPFCVDSNVVAIVAPRREAAYIGLATYHAAVHRDPAYCAGILNTQAAADCQAIASGPVSDDVIGHLLDVAAAAVAVFNQLAADLPKES